MSIEAKHWLSYARDDLAVARMCLGVALWNPCLQNAQQTVEKSLKGLRSRKGLSEKRIHDIRILRRDLAASGMPVELSEDEAELLDSIFMDSKYPGHGVLPDGPPDEATCQQCVAIAERVFAQACRECEEPLV